MTKKSLLNKTEELFMQISAAVIIPLITFSSNCIMVSTALALVMRFQLANEARDMRTFCFISQGLPIPLGIHFMVTGPTWCSIHAVSARYATVFMVTPFLPVRRRFLKA